jgi:hypothetical protein
MRIIVKGLLTSAEVKVKDGKTTTDVLIAQKGEQSQLKARFQGDILNSLKMYSEMELSGRLIVYKTQNGVGSLLMVE